MGKSEDWVLAGIESFGGVVILWTKIAFPLIPSTAIVSTLTLCLIVAQAKLSLTYLVLDQSQHFPW
jgi:hypothetical protein